MASGWSSGRAPIVVRASVIAVALGTSVALLRAQSETVVVVPAGTYDLSQVVTKAGTATNRIRYRAATPQGVTIRGGGTLSRSHVTLEGFFIDNTISPDYQSGDSSHTLTVASNTVGVRVEQSVLKGAVNDIHTGYAWNTNTRDCSESVGHPGGAGLNIGSGANVTVADSIVHGSYNGTNHMNGATLRLERTLMRGNFNGLQVGQGSTLEFVGSVLWDSPNHPIILDSTAHASLLIENSVIVNGQNTVRTIGENGGSHVIVRHSTFYSPSNHPCGSDPGIDPSNVRQQVLIHNNLLAVVANNWWRGMSSQRSYYSSDYNLGFHWSNTSGRELRWDGNEMTLEQWRSATGLDGHSIRARPQFVDPPMYASSLPSTGNASNQWGYRVPTSVAQVRGWLALREGSPGKRAASDGLDMGIADGAGGGSTFAPRAPVNVRIIR